MYYYIIKIILLLIVAMFPFLIYNQYSKKLNRGNDLEESMFLDLGILVSQFLIIETINMFEIPQLMLVSILPCIIALLKSRIFPSIVIFSMLLVFFYENPLFSFLFIIGFIAILILLYIVYKKTSMTKKRFIIYFSLLSIILFIFNYLGITNKSDSVFYNHLNCIICFFVSLNLGSVMVVKIEHCLDIKKHMIEFEHEKELKNSLFKITHEIKNPIAVIKGYLDMFDINDSKKSERYIKIIKGEVDRSLNLLSDFLLFTKVNIEKEVINFNELLSETKELLLPTVEDKKINFSFETETGIYVSLDYNRIKQVILNILKNAVEATEKYGTVKLKAFKTKNSLIILVNDTGCGMSKDTLHSISTPFYTTKQNGTGLGICLSKEIIEAHGGKMIFDSIKGKGTTVKIILPYN